MSDRQAGGDPPRAVLPPEEVMDLVADHKACDQEWGRVEVWCTSQFGRPPSVESLLFLIGVQERGGDIPNSVKKEMKQDLIMGGTYAVLAGFGLYRAGEGGWIRTGTIPKLSELDQERLLRRAIARYLDPLLSGDALLPSDAPHSGD